MTPYRNLNGNSNVVSYEVAEDSIIVVFKSGRRTHYLYNSLRPGRVAVERMKALAAQGHGLNSYISSVVKDNFARKW
ncbi:conserved hypothetical protein [uncultured Stenotrophomonas sp.]|uniref:KTSC domain-containing protein n=1 Tax=uncultured Stenotrophomonas sp. TaxID=165438 RepID=A0A1Y5Q5S9_9GAMM|nr:conserved hypothetical protein [uncultured Stenotrophomonas sp.]